MMAGPLTEIIEIYQPTTSSNSFGEREVSYTYLYKTRAEVVNNSGGRSTVNNEMILTHSKTFRVRIYVPIDNFYRIKWNGKFYRIENYEIAKKSRMIEIQTELVNE